MAQPGFGKAKMQGGQECRWQCCASASVGGGGVPLLSGELGFGAFS
jgi:hypothetical protein